MHPSELTPEIILFGYSQGCFPMPNESGQKVNWYRPDPRAIFPLNTFHVGRTLKRVLKKRDFGVHFNTRFEEVMRRCADRTETWIIDDFIRVYGILHRSGHAHSVEVVRDQRLVGGVYGVSLGSAFFAESMFHTEDNMSKVALYELVEHLKQKGFTLLECQFLTPHLASLGAVELSDSDYILQLEAALQSADLPF